MNLMEPKSMAREGLKLLMLTARCIGDLYNRSLFFMSLLGSCLPASHLEAMPPGRGSPQSHRGGGETEDYHKDFMF